MKRLTILFALIAAPALADITEVQRVICPILNITDDCTISSTGSGNLLVALITMNNTTSVTASMTGGGTWVQGTTCRATSTTAAGSTDIWYVASSTSGATSFEVTTVSTGNPSIGIVFYELTGHNSGAPFDVCAVLSNQTASTNPQGPTVTPAAAGGAVLSLICTAGDASAVASPFTFSGGASPPLGAGFGHRYSAPASANTPSWTNTNSAWCGSTAAFKAAGGAAPKRIFIVTQ